MHPEPRSDDPPPPRNRGAASETVPPETPQAQEADTHHTSRAVSLTNGALAVVVAGLSATVLLDALTLADPVGYSVIGPKTFPIIVSIGLMISAIGIALSTPPPSVELRTMQWGHAALAVISLSSFAFLVEPLGITLTVAALVPLQARLLGSRSPVRDIATGIAFGLAIQLIFGTWLGLPVPAGLLAPLFGA